MKYQVIQSASDGDDVLSTFSTYEDALLAVANIAKNRNGFLQSTWHADAWDMVDPTVEGRKARKFLLVIQAVNS